MKIQKDDSSKDMSKTNLLSSIMWNLIKSNPISPTIYLIMLALDFAYQLLIILSLYSYAGCFSKDLSNIEPYLKFNNQKTFVNQIELYTIFGFLILIVTFFIVEVFMRQKEGQYKRYLLNFISTIFALLRSILLTACLQILSNGQQLVADASSQSKQVILVVILCCSAIILMVIVYVSSCFYNLMVPNTYLPWSETSPKPFILECIHKGFLLLAYAYYSNLVVYHLMLTFCLVALLYKIAYRTRKSFVFNRTVQTVQVASDAIQIHLLLFLELGHLIKKDYFIITIVSLLPPFVIMVFCNVRKYTNTIYSNQVEATNNDSGKHCTYINLLVQLCSKHQQSAIYLHEIKNQHILKCKTYAMSFERQMKNVQQHCREEEDEEHKMMIQEKELCQIRQEQQEEINSDTENYNFATSQIIAANLNKSHTTDSQVCIEDNPSIAFPEASLFSNKGCVQQQNIGNKKKNRQTLRMFELGGQNNSKSISVKQIQKGHLQQTSSKKELFQLVKHLYKHHLLSDKSKDFRLQFLRIYYTYKILQNPYLAHFLLYQLVQSAHKDSILQRNQKLLFKCYIDDLIQSKQGMNQDIVDLEIQKLLELNSLFAKFDNDIGNLSEKIKLFWESLISEKEPHGVYERGISISDTLGSVERLYNDIQVKQGDKKEFKIFLQMAAFYKYVIFKNSDCEHELQKSRNAFQTSKLSKKESESEQVKEKGIIVCTLNLKSSMEIDFINKFGCTFLQLIRNEAIGQKLNSVMPQVISENHQRIIDNFLLKGKHGMVNTKRSMYLKQKNGHIVPSYTYLFLNQMNKNQMVLLFEQNYDFVPFEEDPKNPYSVLLLDKYNSVFEISESCYDTCYISYSLIQKQESMMARQLMLDDLFDCIIQGESVYDGEYQEIQVRARYDEYLEIINEEDSEEVKVETSLRFKSSLYSIQDRLNMDSNNNEPIFTLRIFKERFIDLSVEMKIVAIRPLYRFNSAELHNNILSQNKPLKQLTNQSGSMMYDKLGKTFVYNNSSTETQTQCESELDLSSISSVSSTSLEAIVQRFNNQANQIKSTKLPRTLRIILQLILVMFVLMLTTSVVSLVLTLKNFKAVDNAFNNSRLTLVRINCINNSRLLVRALINISNKNFKYDSETLRMEHFNFYTKQLKDNYLELKLAQDQFDSQRLYISDQFKYIKIYFYYQNKQQGNQRYLTSQAINLFINYGFDLIQTIETSGMQSIVFNNTFANLGLDAKYVSPIYNSYEQIAVMLIYNTRQNLYEQVRDFQDKYNHVKLEKIQHSLDLSNITSLVCIGVIFICGIIILPMFGMIQNRVLYLMKIFFSITVLSKQSMIERINKYKDSFIVQENQNPSKGSNHNSRKRIEEQKQRSCNNNADNFVDIQIVVAPQRNQNNILKKQSSKALSRQKSRIDKNKNGNASNSSSEEEDVDGQYKNAINIKKQQEQIEDQQSSPSSNSTFINIFTNSIKKKKMISQITISFIVVLLSSYFLITYLMSTNDFSLLPSSISSLKLLYSRQTCGVCVASAIQDKLQLNTTFLVNNGTIDFLEYYFTTCQQVESDFHIQIKQNFPVYLESIKPYFDQLESAAYCDAVYGEPFTLDGNVNAIREYRITANECKTMLNGVAALGLTNIYSVIYQRTNQIRLLYLKAFVSQTTSYPFFREQIQGVIPLIVMIEQIISEGNMMLQKKSLESILNYFKAKSYHFIFLFVAFLIIILLMFLVFLLSNLYY